MKRNTKVTESRDLKFVDNQMEHSFIHSPKTTSWAASVRRAPSTVNQKTWATVEERRDKEAPPQVKHSGNARHYEDTPPGQCSGEECDGPHGWSGRVPLGQPVSRVLKATGSESSEQSGASERDKHAG